MTTTIAPPAWKPVGRPFGAYCTVIDGQTIQMNPRVRVESSKLGLRVVCAACGVLTGRDSQDQFGPMTDQAISHADWHYNAFMADHPFPTPTGNWTCPCEASQGRTGLCAVCAN